MAAPVDNVSERCLDICLYKRYFWFFYILYINNMHFADIIIRRIYLLWTVKSNNFTMVGWAVEVPD